MPPPRALLAEVQQGTQLRPANVAPIAKPPVDLLAQIKSGKNLKSVAVKDIPPPTPSNGDDLANALRNALSEKFKSAHGNFL